MVVLGVVTLGLLGALYYFLTFDSPQEVSQATPSEVVKEDNRVFFDDTYASPEGWELWEGMSANMSTFVNLNDVYDPYDIEGMQSYLNNWDPSETDVLVYVRTGTVDSGLRDYEQIVAIANTQADDPRTYDDIRIVLYNRAFELPDEETTSEIHQRSVVAVAGVDADYFRMKSLPGHDSVNLSIPYKDKMVSLYKSVPKEMTDEDVFAVLVPFVEMLLSKSN